MSFPAAIQRYEKGNIDVLTCGPVPLRPSELLMSERFRALMTGQTSIMIL